MESQNEEPKPKPWEVPIVYVNAEPDDDEPVRNVMIPSQSQTSLPDNEEFLDANHYGDETEDPFVIGS
jgi:hypothetical protein